MSISEVERKAMLRLYQRAKKVHPEFPRYLAAAALMAVCGGVFENTYNNYLWEQFRLAPDQRGNLELVREFPGLMNVFLMGVLAAFAETRIAALSAVLTAVGVIGFAIKGDVWGCMIAWTLLWGIGTHLIMPIASSLTMRFGGESKRGRRLGQVAAVGTIGSIIGAGVVWLVFDLLGDRGAAADVAAGVEPSSGIAKWQFDLTFYFAAAACLVAGWYYWSLKTVGSRSKRPPLVMKRRYWLYYVLNLLYGARKQVFLTFGRWVLVVVFMQSPSTFAKLWIISSLIGIFFNPFVGRLVDRLGERKVLMIDSVVLMLVCFGYGAAEHLPFGPQVALVCVCACFVIDHLFFAVGMARETYMSKIAESERDLTASLSMGVSINHLVAATIPMGGGLLWEVYGYESVFMAAGVIALIMLFFAGLVRVPSSAELGRSTRADAA